MRARVYVYLSSVAILLCSAVPARAQMSGTVGAQLTLTSGCVFSGSAATSGVDLGNLDFGSRAATFTGVATAQLSGGIGGSGGAQILCSPDLNAISISVDGGNNAGAGSTVGTGSRALASGSSFVPYDVFANAGFTTVYPADGSAVPVSLTTPGQLFTLPLYGRINKTSTAALAPGSYSDSLQVTIVW